MFGVVTLLMIVKCGSGMVEVLVKVVFAVVKSVQHEMIDDGSSILLQKIAAGDEQGGDYYQDDVADDYADGCDNYDYGDGNELLIPNEILNLMNGLHSNCNVLHG